MIVRSLSRGGPRCIGPPAERLVDDGLQAGEEFFERVDWSGDQPTGWRPHEDPASPTRIKPLVRFGMPAIGGISTEAIAGELDAGASLEEVAEDFGLDLDAVRWAQSYELSQRAAA